MPCINALKAREEGGLSSLAYPCRAVGQNLNFNPTEYMSTPASLPT